jgi:hypothetical protein
VPGPVLKAQQEFDTQLAERLDGMADRLSGKDVGSERSLEPLVVPLEKSVQENCPTEMPDCLPALRSLLRLCRQVDSILSSLDQETFSP